jgi:putative MATE family efflux protein
VFPVLMLMVMMSNGGIGGGMASAVARAVGGRRTRDVNALAIHAILVAILFGLAFTAAVLGGGASLYRLMGGSGAALDAAVQYSSFVFGSAVLAWIVNLLSAALRGAGEVKIPAAVFGGAMVIVPLSPIFIFGLGPVPALGIAGAGVAVLIYYLMATAVLLTYMRSARSPIRLIWADLEWRLFKDILGVGGISAIGTVQMNLTVAIVTALVGTFGGAALAGYGMASRLDYLLIPLLFGFGTATVTMVGANLGAGNAVRARRIAWTSAFLAGAAVESIGVLAALFPDTWTGLFSNDPTVLEISGRYLRLVGPTYAFVGIGMMLYFAGQGAKRVFWQAIAGTARMIFVGIGGWLVLKFAPGDLTVLFTVIAAAATVFGCLVMLATYLQTWNVAQPER